MFSRSPRLARLARLSYALIALPLVCTLNLRAYAGQDSSTKFQTPPSPVLLAALGPDGKAYAVRMDANGALIMSGASSSSGGTSVNWRGTYSSANTYAVGDAVTLNGSSYLAIAGSSSTSPQNPATATSYWGLLALAGTNGTSGSNGQGFAFKGAWTASTAYNAFDVLTNAGSAYVVTTAFTSGATFSTTSLSLLASAGASIAPPTNYTSANTYAQYALVTLGGVVYQAQQAVPITTPPIAGTTTAYWAPIADAAGSAAAVTTTALQKSSNLGDVANAASALANIGGVATAQVGVPSGLATLDVNGIIPTSQGAKIAQTNLLAYYDFHEAIGQTPGTSAAGAVIHNRAATGATYDWTLPATNAPVWTQGGLSWSGSACATLPVLQSQFRSFTMHYYLTPTVNTSTSWLPPYVLGSTTGTTGWSFQLTSGEQPWLRDSSNGFPIFLVDQAMYGAHAFTMNLANSGPSTGYLDGAPITTGGVNPAPATAVGLTMGCNGATANSSNVPLYVTSLALYTAAQSVPDLTQTANAILYDANVAKALPLTQTVSPIDTIYGRPVIIATGDSTTTGANSGTGTLTPYINYINMDPYLGQPWTYAAYGMPGGGTAYPIGPMFDREFKAKPINSSLLINTIWLGINGLSTTNNVCPEIRNSREHGFDPWVMTLYSLAGTSPETTRETYNSQEVQQAFACGAKGLIDIGSDVNIGASGKNNGSSTYWTGAAGQVHANTAGYTYVGALIKKTLTAYYYANMNVPTVQSTTGTDNVQDRNVILDNTSAAFTRTLPDCNAMTGMEYIKYLKTSANTVTLSPALPAQLIDGGTTFTMSAKGRYKFSVQPIPAASGGGCTWMLQ